MSGNAPISDGSTTLQILDIIIAGSAAVIGALFGSAGVIWSQGRKEGEMTTRIDAIEETQETHRKDFDKHVEKHDSVVTKLTEKTDSIRDQFGDLKATMATRTDIASIMTAMQTGFSALSARVDNALNSRRSDDSNRR